ncbi:FecR domain-containing protein [Butyricimonas paravirosa]
MIDEIENKRIRIRDYLSGDLDNQEKQDFQEWLERDLEAQRLFREQVKQYHQMRWAENWDRLDDYKAFDLAMQRVRRRHLRVTILKYVAVIAVALTTGFVTWQWKQQKERGTSPMIAVTTTLQASVPVLTLDNGEQVSITPQNVKELHASRNMNVQLIDSVRLTYIPKMDSSIREVRYNTLTVPRGCEFDLTLADGSRVWLNAGSSLKYPEVFVGNKREVYLSGEAYFEVKHNGKASFIVNTDKMNVRVLGTSFNIKAYGDDPAIVTTLVTGKIAQVYPEINQEITLTPLRQSVFDRSSGKLEIRETDTREALAWKNGKIIANNERLEDIFRQLSRWYDFEIVYTQPSLKDTRFYLHTLRYTDVQTILNNLQTTLGIHFTYSGKTIYVSQ